MTITLNFAWWWIPTALTIAAFVVWWFCTPEEHGMFAGLGAALALIPALFFCLVLWLIAALMRP